MVISIHLPYTLNTIGHRRFRIAPLLGTKMQSRRISNDVNSVIQLGIYLQLRQIRTENC